MCERTDFLQAGAVLRRCFVWVSTLAIISQVYVWHYMEATPNHLRAASPVFCRTPGDCAMCVAQMWPRFYWLTDVTRWMIMVLPNTSWPCASHITTWVRKFTFNIKQSYCVKSEKECPDLLQLPVTAYDSDITGIAAYCLSKLNNAILMCFLTWYKNWGWRKQRYTVQRFGSVIFCLVITFI